MRAASFARRAVGGCAVLLALAAAGCDGWPFGPDRERVPATIELGESDPVEVVVPAVVTRGVPFDVTVTTYGGGCIEEADTEVEVQGALAVVRPYQILVHHDICTLELNITRRTVRVRLDTPGPGRVVVHGRSEASDQEITVERAVTVQ